MLNNLKSGDANACNLDELPDHVEESWCVDDVLYAGDSLTDHQARLVLQRIEEEFDAGLGINWEVIENTIAAMRGGDGL